MIRSIIGNKGILYRSIETLDSESKKTSLHLATPDEICSSNAPDFFCSLRAILGVVIFCFDLAQQQPPD